MSYIRWIYLRRKWSDLRSFNWVSVAKVATEVTEGIWMRLLGIGRLRRGLCGVLGGCALVVDVDAGGGGDGLTFMLDAAAFCFAAFPMKAARALP